MNKPNKPLNILIVEDSAADAKLALNELRAAGFELTWKRIETESEFLAEIKQLPDIIISDYSMPQFSGLRAAELLRESGLGIPFILISGKVGEEVVIEALKAGASDYVLKWNLKRLGQVIQRALREAEERKLKHQVDQLLNLRTRALQATANGVVITDRAGVIQWVNPSFTKLTGYSPEEAIGCTPRILKSGAHDAAFYKNLWGTIVEGKSWEGILTNRRKDGHLFQSAHTITPVRNAAGETTHIVGIMNDITKRVQAEKERVEALNLIETILAVSPVGILGYLATGPCVSVNEAAAVIVGGTKESLGAQNFREIESWKTSGLLTAAEKALQTRTPVEIEAHFVTTFGKEMWVNFRFTAFFLEGQLHLLAVFADISQRKLASIQIERRERQFSSLIENSSDMITVVDSEGVVLFESPSEENILGYRVEELIGRSAFDFIHPGDAAKTIEALQKALSDSSKSFSEEHQFRHRDGSWHVMQSIGRSILWDGVTPAVVVNSRDITEIRKLEEQFRQAQKMEAVGQLAGGVAHDFNNILMTINGYSDLALHTEGMPPEAAEMLKEVYAAGERAAKLTRQLLAFSRKQVAHVERMDLNGVLTDVLEMLRRMVGERVKINVNPQQGLPGILADSGMIEQVLMNLAVNARDAMPNGGTLLISTEAVVLTEEDASKSVMGRAGEFVCLAVKDSGTGIAPEILPKIFEPFFTTKAEGKGTGLGLSTVFGIVKQHRGWLAVETEVGRGTTFKIYFPVESRAAQSAAGATPVAEIVGGKETVLVVEDDGVVRDLAVLILGKLGYRALQAATGDEALEVWERHGDRIDLLLTDMVMPGSLTGRELAEQLQGIKPSLKVIFSSGYSAAFAGQIFDIRQGAPFLQKPYPPRKLAAIVRKCLDQTNRSLQTPS